jgi:hypothetical protein
VLWHRERVVTSIAENSDLVVALARGMREPAGRSRRIRAGAHASPGERGASRARDDSVVTSADGGLRAVRVARLRPPHRRLGPDHLDGPGRQNRCPQLGHRGLVAKSVLEPRLETCPGLGQVAQSERDACRADRVDGLRVAVLEMSWVTGQTVFADGGLALHSPIDAYGQVQRVIARRQAGSAER